MLLNLEIKDPTVATKSGEKNGKPWKIEEQFGFLEINGERRRIVVPVGRNEAPKPAGKYTVNLLDHLRVGKYGRLEMDDRLQLSPVK